MPLAAKELRLLLLSSGLDRPVSTERVQGADFLCFDAEALEGAASDRISQHSMAYLLFAEESGGSLRPLCGRAPARVGEDLSAVLKYKGKTNEVFTRFLINLARAASRDGFREGGRLLDPMCGRGTTLFEAINRGISAVGGDLDRADLDEGCQYLKRYFSYHHISHKAREHSLTLKDGGAVRVREFSLRPGGDAAPLTLSFAQADARKLPLAFGKRVFNLAVFDLPYGVQHAQGKKGGLEETLAGALGALGNSLAPGGAAAFSFNTHTLKTDRARAIAREAGLVPAEGEEFYGLAHWVEQAIERDAIVCTRP